MLTSSAGVFPPWMLLLFLPSVVHVVFQSVFRVAYEKTHFSVFVIEVVFEYPLKLFILIALATLFKF